MSDRHVILVGGAVRSGKTRFAEEAALRASPRPVYIATAQAYDDEMRARIARHQADRAGRFTTVEAPLKLAEALVSQADAEAVVVDCLTLWLSNVLMSEPSDAQLAAHFDALQNALDTRRGCTVLVTNEVGLGIVPTNALARRFRDEAGRLHQRLAASADEVVFGAMGLRLRLKPGPVCVC